MVRKHTLRPLVQPQISESFVSFVRFTARRSKLRTMGIADSTHPTIRVLRYFITPTLQSLSLCDIGRKFQSRRKILWQLLSANPLKIYLAQSLSPSSAPRKRARGRWESIGI